MVAKTLKNLFTLIESLFIEKTPVYKTTGHNEKHDFFSCPHDLATKPFVVLVAGKKCEFESSPFCASCTEKYINDFGTICNSCEQPIFPGDPIAMANRNAKYKYTHVYMGCCPTGGLIYGRWGNGRAIPLEKINPKKYGSKQVTDIA